MSKNEKSNDRKELIKTYFFRIFNIARRGLKSNLMKSLLFTIFVIVGCSDYSNNKAHQLAWSGQVDDSLSYFVYGRINKVFPREKVLILFSYSSSLIPKRSI